MAFSTSYVFGFAAGICVVCSLAVASASMGLRDLQELNQKRDVQRSILSALSLPEDGSVPAGEEIDRLWAERVRIAVIDAQGNPADAAKEDRDGNGVLDEADVALAAEEAKGSGHGPSILSVFQRVDGGTVDAYAIPVQGVGLWGPLSGYLAVQSDGRTIMGATFFAPKETPGLGAEIMESKFRSQWPGKTLADASGAPSTVKIAKPGLCGSHPNCVQGVSGATITSRGVDAMVAKGVEVYNPYLERIRQGGTR